MGAGRGRDRRLADPDERVGLALVATFDGVVGSPAARRAATISTRARIASLSGSTAAANRRLAAVYSWPK